MNDFRICSSVMKTHQQMDLCNGGERRLDGVIDRRPVGPGGLDLDESAEQRSGSANPI